MRYASYDAHSVAIEFNVHIIQLYLVIKQLQSNEYNKLRLIRIILV